MTGIQTGSVVAAVVYCCILVGLALHSSRKDKSATATGKKFYLGNGLGIIVLLFSMLASTFSTWVIMGCPPTTYNTGLTWVMLVTLYQISMSFTCGYLGPRFWRLRRERDYVTQADLVVDFFGDNKIRYLFAIGFVLGMASACVAQFRAMGTAIQTASGGNIPYWAAAGFLYLAIAAYSVIGGLQGASIVDTFQGILFTAVLFGGLIVAVTGIGGLGSGLDQVAAVDMRYVLYGDNSPESLWIPITAITFCINTIFGGGFTPGFWQRYYASKDTQTLKRMSIWFPILCSIGVTTTGGIVGLLAHAYEQQGVVIENPASVFQLLLTQISSPIWSVLIVVAVLAAGMSTVGGYMNGSSMIITYDVIRTVKPGTDDVKFRDYGRVIIVVLMGVAYLISIFASSAVSALIALAASFYATAIYPVFTIFVWKRGTYAGTLAGMICSLVAVIVTNFIIKTPIHAGVWGLIFGFGAYFIVSLMTKPVTQEQRDRFMAPLKRTKVYAHTFTE